LGSIQTERTTPARETGGTLGKRPAPSRPRTHEERWEGKFQALVAFREEEGHCRVPQGAALSSLRQWLAQQRQHVRTGTLSSERRERLERLDALGRGPPGRTVSAGRAPGIPTPATPAAPSLEPPPMSVRTTPMAPAQSDDGTSEKRSATPSRPATVDPATCERPPARMEHLFQLLNQNAALQRQFFQQCFRRQRSAQPPRFGQGYAHREALQHRVLLHCLSEQDRRWLKQTALELFRDERCRSEREYCRDRGVAALSRILRCFVAASGRLKFIAEGRRRRDPKLAEEATSIIHLGFLGCSRPRRSEIGGPVCV